MLQFKLGSDLEDGKCYLAQINNQLGDVFTVLVQYRLYDDSVTSIGWCNAEYPKYYVQAYVEVEVDEY